MVVVHAPTSYSRKVETLHIFVLRGNLLKNNNKTICVCRSKLANPIRIFKMNNNIAICKEQQKKINNNIDYKQL